MATTTPSEIETDIAAGARSGGYWHSTAPNFAVYPPGEGGPADLGLFAVVVDLAGDPEGRDELSRYMVQAARAAYFNASGSTTQGLKAAAEAANSTLYQANSMTTRDMRRHAGVGLAALVGSDLYLAQAGPSLIYVVQAGDLLQFPSESPWLSGAGDEDGDSEGGWYPLGIRRQIDIDLYHVEVGDDDTVVVSTPSAAQLATGDFLDALLDQPPQDIVNDLAQLASNAASDPELAVIAMRIEGTGVETVSVPPAPHPDYAQPDDVAPVAPRTPSGPSLTDRLASASKSVASGVGKSTGNVLKQTLPNSADAGKMVPRGPSMWRLLAVIIPLLLLIGGGFYVFQSAQQRRAQDDRVAALLSQAQDRLTAATGSQADRQSTLNLLNFADEMTQEALRIRPNNESARKLQLDIQKAKEETGGIYRLGDLKLVTSVSDTGAIPRGLWVNGPQAYMLDVGLNRLLRVRLGQDSATPETVLKTGDQAGGKSVDVLADMVWLRSGGARTNEDIGALARDGVLWDVNATGGKTPIQFSGSRDWQNPLVADTYSGNFYLAQADRGQILRWTPTGNDGYSDAATQWLAQPADLKGLVDMGIDGQIFMLMSDGRVRRFTAGKEDKFEVKGLDKPLANPLALFVTPDSRSLYVLEAGRIVELNKDGGFVRQFQGPDEKSLDNPRALFVDEKGEQIYVVNGAGLYTATLPKPKATKPAP